MSYKILKDLFHFSKKDDAKTNHLDAEKDHLTSRLQESSASKLKGEDEGSSPLNVKTFCSSESKMNLYVGPDYDVNYIETIRRDDSSWEIVMFTTDKKENDESNHGIANALFDSMVKAAKTYGIKRIIVQPVPYGRDYPVKEGTDFGDEVYGKRRGFRYVTKTMCEKYAYLNEKMMYLDL